MIVRAICLERLSKSTKNIRRDTGDALIKISVVLALRKTSYTHGDMSAEIVETTVSLYVLFTAACSGFACETPSAFYKL